MGGEREKKEKEGRERRKGEAAPANSLPSWPECSACQKSSALWLSLHEELDRFYLLRTNLLRRRGIFLALLVLASATKCTQNAF